MSMFVASPWSLTNLELGSVSKQGGWNASTPPTTVFYPRGLCVCVGSGSSNTTLSGEQFSTGKADCEKHIPHENMFS